MKKLLGGVTRGVRFHSRSFYFINVLVFSRIYILGNSKSGGLGFLIYVLFFIQPAHSITTFNPADVSAVTSAAVKSLIQTTAVGLDHRAYSAASALPAVVGIDLGVDFTFVKTPVEFKSAINLITQQPSSSVPDTVPIPRVNFHKGLGVGIEVGGSFINYQNIIKIYGADLKWAFIRGGTLSPSFATHVSANFSSLWFIKTHTYKADFLVSKNLVFIEPYLGAGIQHWSGKLSVPGLPISGEQSSTSAHFFAGLPIKLLILRLTTEIDYSLVGLTTYGGKLSFSF